MLSPDTQTRGAHVHLQKNSSIDRNNPRATNSLNLPTSGSNFPIVPIYVDGLAILSSGNCTFKLSIPRRSHDVTLWQPSPHASFPHTARQHARQPSGETKALSLEPPGDHH